MITGFPLYLGIIIIIAVLAIPIGLTIFIRFFQHQDVEEDVKTLVCMLVSVPRDSQAKPSEAKEPAKDFKALIAPMEQFYSSLTTIIHQRTFFDWLFSTPAKVSLEITSVGGAIQFAIVCPKRISTIVERQIHSFFASAEIPPPYSP
ncbi:MAG TPA: hypothetical protein VMQ44_01155, partial [Candidatus Saccharimonadales bacterium]|nr:hypothetical protein [Candidatus Saccharimonadales bacterium]